MSMELSAHYAATVLMDGNTRVICSSTILVSVVVAVPAPKVTTILNELYF